MTYTVEHEANRAFFPGGGFGPGFGPGFFPGAGFGGPFFNPFFFPRRFFPFFFLSPFRFPFFRGEEDRDGQYYAQHSCQEGETLRNLAQMYNCPQPILEAMNPHLQNPHALATGTVVQIPRLDTMFCHKMFMEQGAPDNAPLSQMAPMPMAPMQMPQMQMPTGAAPQMPGMVQSPQMQAPYAGAAYSRH